ncbi:unnamed protein product, partial [marine sediment metagenome]
WQAGSSKDASSIQANPKFTDAANANFTLQATSPAIDAGVDVSLTADFDGNIVPASIGLQLPDIGAYERQTGGGYENRFKRWDDFWKFPRY